MKKTKDAIVYYTVFNYAYVMAIAETASERTPVGSCKINYDFDTNSISIASWFVDASYQRRGIGKALISEALKTIPIKYSSVTYIWNGKNQYVLDWLTSHFNAQSLCPIHILKYTFGDDWDNHIYKLDTDLFIKYFNTQTQNK